MASAVSPDEINGYIKARYGEVERACPNFAVLKKRVPLSQQERLGDNFNFPVFLRRSHGATFNGDSTLGTAFSLNEAVSLQSKNAQVDGTEFVLREKVAYQTVSRARAQGEAAFGNAMDEILLQMKEAADFYGEICDLYGQSSTGIGKIESVTDGGADVCSFVITKATWAPGLWAQMENAYIDVWDDDGDPKRNAAGTIQVTAVDPDTRTVTVAGTEAELDTIVADDFVVPRGWIKSTTPTYNVYAGLDKILTNTGSLFGIDAATYNLWKPNTHSAASAAATMGKIQAALAKAVVRGLMEDVEVLLSVFTWTDLLNDLSALRRYAEDTKSEMSLGTTSIKFYGANGGTMELIPHPMVKAGEAFMLPLKRLKRIGSTDTTFRLPTASGQGENMYVELADSAGFQLRCYWDKALIHTQPAKCVKITNIVNTSL